MDVELKETMDEIMELMHQISWWMMELEQKEIDGVKIAKEQVLENKAINILFGKVQNQYRELESLIVQKIKEKKEGYIENNSEKTDDYLLDQMIKELNNYIGQSYINIAYIPFKYGKNNVVSHSIYEGTPYKRLIESEYALQIINLDRIQSRIVSNRIPDKYSFTDKNSVLVSIVENEFFNNFVFKYIENYEEKCDKYKNDIPSDVYEFQIENIKEKKYIEYLTCLNCRYNGYIQEHDYGKFGKAKAFIDEGLEKTLLNMSEYEIKARTTQIESNLKNFFRKNMEEFEIPFERKTQKLNVLRNNTDIKSSPNENDR